MKVEKEDDKITCNTSCNISCNVCGRVLKNDSECCNEWGECWECVKLQEDAEYLDDIYYDDF